MPRSNPPQFRKTLLALAVGAALAPYGAWALDLAEAPPGVVEPYVRPNVIISVDDSGSMGWRVTSTAGGDNAITAPNPDGSWPANARRMNVLKYALTSIFDPTHPKYDPSLLPDKKIRIAWQAMWNNGGSPGIGPQKTSGNTTSKAGANSVYNGTDTPTAGTNSMKVLDNTHRTNFISFVDKLDAGNGTPSHWMFSQADAYMRSNVNSNGPWSGNPGGSDTASTPGSGENCSISGSLVSAGLRNASSKLPDRFHFLCLKQLRLGKA